MIYNRGETALIMVKTEVYIINTEKYEIGWVDTNYPKITIIDSQSNKVIDSQPMVKSSIVGTYYYDYDIEDDAPTDVWSIIVESSVDEKKTLTKFSELKVV